MTKTIGSKWILFFLLQLFIASPLLAQRTAPAQKSTPKKQSASKEQRAKELAALKPKVYEMKSLLKELGYWVVSIDSNANQEFKYQLSAFRRIEKLPKNKPFSDVDLEFARRAVRPLLHEYNYAHIEIDLNRQVLMYTDGAGDVFHVLPISTGNGELFTSEGWSRHAVTPRGKFKVYYKVTGWKISPLGALYYPLYIKSGIAIHGSLSVPESPASHGCIRIPMIWAKLLFDITPVGTPVLVYGEPPVKRASK